MNRQKKILVCPLDWGLGHATRCIPLIQYFLEKNCEVLVAGNSTTNALIQKEFPALTFLELKGYQVQYASSAFLLPWKILVQLPRLSGIIQYEHRWLGEMIDRYKIDLVISDNRYGLHSKRIPSIFMTHQLQIAVPQSAFMQKVVNMINRRFIRRFSAVWVPDYENHEMSGKLSEHHQRLSHVEYIGNLSRFEKKNTQEVKYHKIFLLSGPEPQRTKLEKRILWQIRDTKEQILLVRGKPGEESVAYENKQISIENHLGRNELQEVLLQSEMIICRSGYSSIMDLIKLNRNALLIPTPGQTEQEYLAAYLAQKKWFLTADQSDLDLDKETRKMRSFPFSPFPKTDMELYKKVIDKMLQNTFPATD